MRRTLASAIATLLAAALVPMLPFVPAEPAGAITRSIVFPVKGGASWSDTFGACRGTHCERSHMGQDLFAPKHRPLLATVNGTVDNVGFNLSLSGHYVSIKDSAGYRYLYIHLNNDNPGTDDGRAGRLLAVAPGIHVGAKVRAGQVIGYLGDSGNAESTPPHVHFEIRTPDNVSINPADSLRAAKHTALDEAAWRDAHGPRGTFSFWQLAPSGAHMAGWSIDRSSSLTVPIEVHAAGALQAVVPANVARADLAKWGKGENHAFDRVVALPGGVHNVCLYAGDPDGGPALGLGCRTMHVRRGAPFGALDKVSLAGPHRVRGAGWALDPDVADPIGVHLYARRADGSLAGRVSLGLTTGARPDVARVWPGWSGSPRGYGGTVGATGLVQVCAYGINVGLGGTAPVGCRTIDVPVGAPRGAVDVPVALGDGRFAITGYAIDPDTTAPIGAHVHVLPLDGSPRTIASAGLASHARGDAAAAWPGWGEAHGFATEVTVTRSSKVCVYGLNAAGTEGGHRNVGCRVVEV